MIETLGILCMWQNLFYYLRIFDRTNHLFRMITEVAKDMGAFLLIFIITHVAFAETFFYVSSSSAKQFQFVGNFFDAFRYSFMISLGTYGVEKFNSLTDAETGLISYNEHKWLCWLLMMSAQFITFITMA